MKLQQRKRPERVVVTVTALKASDFPNAPGLIARMLEGTLVKSVPYKLSRNVADGHD